MVPLRTSGGNSGFLRADCELWKRMGVVEKSVGMLSLAFGSWDEYCREAVTDCILEGISTTARRQSLFKTTMMKRILCELQKHGDCGVWSKI